MADFSIMVSENNNYLICTIHGPMSVEIGKAVTLEVGRQSRATGLKRFLFDVRNAPYVADVSSQYFFVNRELPALDFIKDPRSAVLIDPTDRTHDFMENMLQEAGINMRIFESMNEAVQWLLSAK